MSTPAVTIRWAVESDAPEIAAVHVASWRAAYAGLLPEHLLADLSVEHRTGQWSRWLAPDGDRALTLVGEHDGRIVGFCTLALPTRDEAERDDVGEIPALYLRPETRRQGVGSALVDAALREMRTRGFREAVLWMLTGNDPAEAFYLRTGWRRDGGTRGSQYFPDLEELTEVRFRRRL